MRGTFLRWFGFRVFYTGMYEQVHEGLRSETCVERDGRAKAAEFQLCRFIDLLCLCS